MMLEAIEMDAASIANFSLVRTLCLPMSLKQEGGLQRLARSQIQPDRES